ncbi:MAG: response regulator [bacterium]|nr:response regulator [bacterium]
MTKHFVTRQENKINTPSKNITPLFSNAGIETSAGDLSVFKPRKTRNPAHTEAGKSGKSAVEKRAKQMHTSPDASAIDPQLLLQELRMHQCELEMQNEELRNSRAQLEQSHAKYSHLYDYAPVGYFVFDEHGVIREVNLTGAQMLNVGKETLIQKQFSKYLSPDDADAFFLHLRAVCETGDRRACECRLNPEGNTPLYVRLVSLPAENNHIRTTISDISDRKQAEEEKRKLEKQLRRSQKLESIGTLAGGIAHDFNNILTGLFGNIELAKQILQPDHHSYKYIDYAGQALQKAKRLTNQLLTFAKGGAPILETISLQQVVTTAVTFNLSGSNIKAHLNLPDDLHPVKADKGQIDQAITNLVINAKQAMPNGGNLYIDAENLDLSGESSDHPSAVDLIKLCIRDDGGGILPEHIESIFDPYFSTKQAGSGMGLATVYSIIGRHKGHISVDSTPVAGTTAGTTFTILLPAEKSAIIPSASTQPVPTETSTPISGHILIMDDDEIVRTVSIEMLDKSGFTSATALNGEEALEKYIAAAQSNRPYDMVIMDLTIPGGMGGKQAVKKLLAINPLAKAIVASGYSTDPVMAEYRSYGFKGRLFKPFHMDDLQAEVVRVMKME